MSGINYIFCELSLSKKLAQNCAHFSLMYIYFDRNAMQRDRIIREHVKKQLKTFNKGGKQITRLNLSIIRMIYASIETFFKNCTWSKSLRLLQITWSIPAHFLPSPCFHQLD